jgi:glycosyltransferase involved in cell wall biosynthesis
MAIPELEILLPVHNEAESIEATIRELYTEISKTVNVGFIICEDGSRDNTKEIIRSLAQEIPMRLNLSDDRKGYSRAVREGMLMLEAEWLLCVDSDGQCDPKDFAKFWENRDKADVLLGWRVDRQDTFARKSMSRLFYTIYQAAFHTPVHDPSCPYMVCKKAVAHELADKLREMKEGFWWEFVARVHRGGYRIYEIPVKHRLRAAGVTQVYKVKKMPGIFIKHVLAIFRIREQTKAS